MLATLRLRALVSARRGFSDSFARMFAEVAPLADGEVPPQEKEGKVMHPDLLNDNIKRT